MRTAGLVSLTALLIVQPAASPAQTAASAPSPLKSVLDCTAIAEPSQRLACFDREVGSLSQAQRTGEVVIMDREQLGKTRRSLFGLALPNLGIFGGDANAEDSGELETTITRAQQDGRGRWTLDLAEGGRWVQTDSKMMVVDPAPGHPIKIRRAALGSYLANIKGQRAIRVRRAN